MMNKILIITPIVIFMFWAIFHVYVENHENTHIMIGESYGCVDWGVRSSVFGGEYKCLEYIDRPDEWVMAELNLHLMNEVKGYNTKSLLFGLVCFMFLFVFFKLNEEKK